MFQVTIACRGYHEDELKHIVPSQQHAWGYTSVIDDVAFAYHAILEQQTMSIEQYLVSAVAITRAWRCLSVSALRRASLLADSSIVREGGHTIVG